MPPFANSGSGGQARLADWKTLLTWSDLLELPWSRESLIENVRKVGKYRALRLITAINCVAQHSGTLSIQIPLASDFTKHIGALRGPIVEQVSLGHVLFAAEPIIILAKFVVDFGAEEEVAEEAEVMEAFVKAVLLINELFGQEQLAIRAGDAGDIESFLPVELRAAALEHEPFEHLAARLYSFVKWARNESPDSKDYCDIDSAFADVFNMNYEDVSAAGLFVRHYFHSINSVEQIKLLNPILDVESLVLTLREQQHVRRFIDAYSMSIEELVKAWAGRDKMSAAALLPLQKMPLIRVKERLYACPSLDFISAALGIGLFHRLAEHYGSKGRRLHFHHFFARFLQVHAERVITAAVAKKPATILPEFSYRMGKQRKDSSDVILIEGRKAVFFDICNKRLNTELSLNSGDVAAMRRDIDGMVIDQAKQLDGRINDFINGAYEIDGLTAADIDTIIPVAITHQSIHGWVGTRRYIDRRLREEDCLQQGPRLEIISVAELETLVQAFGGELSFTDLLLRRSSHPEEVARARSLKNYLLLNAGWDGKDKSPMPAFEEWFDIAVAKLQSWGAQF